MKTWKAIISSLQERKIKGTVVQVLDGCNEKEIRELSLIMNHEIDIGTAMEKIDGVLHAGYYFVLDGDYSNKEIENLMFADVNGYRKSLGLMYRKEILK